MGRFAAAAMGMRSSRQTGLEPADRADDELGACGDRGPAGVAIEHGADTNQRAAAELFVRHPDAVDGVGCGHGDLDSDNSAFEQRVGERNDLLGLLRPDDGDDAGIFEQGDDFRFRSHIGKHIR